MKELEPIYIRIAECKACVNDEDGNFDELASQVLAEVLQVKELLDDSSDLPHIQLEESVWCDFLDCNIDAVFITEKDAIHILSSSRGGANLYQYLPIQIPRQTMLEVMLQIEKQIKCVEGKRWWGIYHLFFKQDFRFWHKTEGRDLLYSLQMAVMETKNLKHNPFKPRGEEVNQTILQQFCHQWESTINDIINEVNEGASYDDIRVCDNCGLPMSDGYYLGGEYACDDECCLALYNGDKAQMEEDLSHADEDCSDCYYTEWESIFFD